MKKKDKERIVEMIIYPETVWGKCYELIFGTQLDFFPDTMNAKTLVG